MTYIFIFISAVFVNNIVLSQLLGINPLLSEPKKSNTIGSLTGFLAFVLIITSTLTWVIQNWVLKPYNLEFLRTLLFIITIVLSLQLIDFIISKTGQTLYKKWKSYLPIITTNSVILGIALLINQNKLSLPESITFACATAIGYGIVTLLLTTLQEQLNLTKLPKAIEGIPALLLTAGLLAMAFMGFAGIVR